MEIAILLNKIAGFSLRAKIETLLNDKSCQGGPGLAAIVINNLLGEDYGGSSPLAQLRHALLLRQGQTPIKCNPFGSEAGRSLGGRVQLLRLKRETGAGANFVSNNSLHVNKT